MERTLRWRERGDTLKLKLGEILVRARVLTQAQLAKALAHQKASGGAQLLGEVLVELGLATEKQLLEALTQSLGLPAVDLRGIEPSPEALAMLPAKQAREQRILPLRILERNGRKRLVVALADPTDVPAIDALQFSSGMVVEVKVTTAGPLMAALERHYGPSTSPPRKLVMLDARSARPPVAAPPPKAPPPRRSAPSARRAAPPPPDAQPAADPDDLSDPGSGGVVALMVRKGPKAGLVVRVPAKASVVFGRGTADVVLADEKMSRRHFAVADTEQGLQLQDLGSSNGTLVNGVKVAETLLRPGDQVQAGATTFEVQLLPEHAGDDEASSTTQKVDAREFQRQAEAKERPRRHRP